MTTVSFDFVNEVENTIVNLERAESLLSLLLEEIDEIPRNPTNEEIWKVLHTVRRVSIFDALSISILDKINSSRIALESQMNEYFKSKKDPCVTDQSTQQESTKTHKVSN